MAGASAPRARADGIIGFGRDLFSRQRLSSEKLAGYARQLSHPAYERLLHSEDLLRRLVPVLIVIFLIIVAVARWIELSRQATALEMNAGAEIGYVADLARLTIEPQLDDPAVALDEHAIQNRLDTALDARMLKDGRLVMVTNSDGEIIAVSPLRQELVGRQLDAALGDVMLLTTFGAKAQVQTTTGISGEMIMAVSRQFSGPLGAITVIQPKARLLAPWREKISLNVTLFVGTASILLVIVYAYFAQSARAREADEIYSRIQNRFDTALMRGRCGLWDWDVARGRLYWSSSMFDMLGMPRHSRLLSFGEVEALVHGKDVNLYELVDQLMAGGGTRTVDHAFRMQHRDGGWVWVRARAELINDDVDQPHLIGIAVDITEQQDLKESNRAADLRLRDAIESLSEAFVLWDNEQRLVLCNSKFRELYDIEPNLALPGMGQDAVFSAGKNRISASQLISAENNENDARTLELRLGDGRWFQINERTTADGGFVSIGTDITAIKRHEEKLVSSERRLMATVSDLRSSRRELQARTVELEAQKQDLSSMAAKYEAESKKADAANRAKSDFLANISHELRTPLNAIIGFSDIMNTGLFGPLGSGKYCEYVRDINQSGTYLLGMINDVLDMSKIEAGRQILERDQVDMVETIDETIRIVSFQAEHPDVEINTNCQGRLRMEADRRAMKQVILNLLSNAVKFSKAGEQVDLRARNVGSKMVITIRDRGIGIPRDDLKKLGQPFEQVQNQFTKSHKGSGLGLAIARSLVEIHGGTMRIASLENYGTVVSLRLPVIWSVYIEHQHEAA